MNKRTLRFHSDTTKGFELSGSIFRIEPLSFVNSESVRIINISAKFGIYMYRSY